MVGNWRLTKFRKSYDTFECMQCGSALLIYKHPSFCEAKVVHKSCLRKDLSFDLSKVEKCPFKLHTPFDDLHKRVSGKTHTGVRYFTKKNMMLPVQQIWEKLKVNYPLLAKFFPPEMRKMNDIAMRERRIMGLPLSNGPKDAGMSAEAILNGGVDNGSSA